MFQTEALASVFRGGYLESEHRGAIAVVDGNGRLLAHSGDTNLATFLRSSAKPFQALPVVSSGAADRFGFTLQEIALITGSHSGSETHLQVIKSILSKIGLTKKALLCGAHSPYDERESKRLKKADEPPSALHNNCSGKHAGMLAVAVDMGQSTSDYLENDHPVQIAIREAIGDLSGINPDDLKLGVDGCSAPTFCMPLHKAALMFAHLAKSKSENALSVPSAPSKRSLVGSGKTWSRTDALAIVANAMTTHPDMVAGSGRLDTEFMQSIAGLVAKGGAEGFQGIGVRQNKNGIEKIYGIAIKIADGNGRRAMGPVVFEVLNQLGLLPSDSSVLAGRYKNPIEKNLRGLEVGEVRADFKLMGVHLSS